MAARRIVALASLVAVGLLAGVVGERHDPTPTILAPPVTDGAATIDAGEPAVELPAGRTDLALPTASPAGSFSTTWYCVGGSGAADGPAPATVELLNRGDTATDAVLTAVGDDGTSSTRAVPLAPRTRVEVPLTQLSAARSVALTVEAPGGDVTAAQRITTPSGTSSAPCTSRAADQWYLAGGSTDRGAEEEIVVYNPFADAATVDVTYFLPDGLRRPERAQGIPVPAHAVTVVRVRDTQDRIVTIGATVSTRTGQVIVARRQSFDGTGEAGPTGQPPKGVSVALGSPWAARRFVLADAAVGAAGSSTRLVVLNPGAEPSTVRLEVQVDSPDLNGQPSPLTLQVPASSWKVLGPEDLRQLPPGVAFSVTGTVTTGGPVVAEAWRYGDPGSPAAGVSVLNGAPVAATDWLVPAAPAAGVTTWLSVVSAGKAATVELAVVHDGKRSRLVLPKGSLAGVGAGGRVSIDLTAALAPFPNGVVLVHATAPVVVAATSSGGTGPDSSAQLGYPLAGTISAP